MTILISGALAYDRIMDFPGYFKDRILPDKIHLLNVSFVIDSIEEKRGGPGGNIAYSLSLFGEKPTLLATLGKDGEPYKSFLGELGLPLDGIEMHADVPTAQANIITDRADNQITGFYIGAMAHETRTSLSGFDPKDTLLIVSPGNKNDMIRYCLEAKRYEIPYIFDPGQNVGLFSADELKSLITGSFCCTVNDYESSVIQDTLKISEEQLGELVKLLITTLGEQGSRMRANGEVIDILPSEVSEVKDPTGAGDAYRAGLILGYCKGLSHEEMGRLGSVAASFAVENYGTQAHAWTTDQFKKRYLDTYKTECSL